LGSVPILIKLEKEKKMKKKSFALIMALILMLALFLTACGTGADSGSPAPTGEPEGVASQPIPETEGESASQSNDDEGTADTEAGGAKKYAVFISQNTNAFTMSVGESAKSHGESLGHEVTLFDGKGDQNIQISQIETCIAQGYDGLIVEPVSGDGAIPILTQAMNENIPVVTIIQELNDQSIVNAFVGPDHYEASVIEAEAALEAIGGKGKVCILRGALGSSAEMLINNAFHDTLEKYADVEVIEEQSANWVIDEALKITETWLQKHSDIAAILGESDQMSLGAMKACQDMGIDNIIIVGRDALPETLEAIRDGGIYATVYQNGPQMGSMAIDTLDTILSGKTVEPVLATKNVLVTVDNIDTFENE
jgi:inositol transport system substrate-binding protein